MQNTLVIAISPPTRKSRPYIRGLQAFTSWPKGKAVWWDGDCFLFSCCKHLAELSHNPAAVWYCHMMLIECLVANKIHMEQIICDAFFFFFITAIIFCVMWLGFHMWRLIFMIFCVFFLNFVQFIFPHLLWSPIVLLYKHLKAY